MHAGEIVGIAGVSGNGQQELGKLISGEDVRSDLAPDAIQIAGKAAAHLNVIERRKLGLAFVPEERLGRGAVPGLSLWQNALLTAHDHGMINRGFVQRRAVDGFTKTCIEQFDVRCGGQDAAANSLSGGNLQKFIVGREMMLAPRLLFLSQPTWGVDIGAATAIRQKLIDLRDQGVGVLVISEELEELFEITDRMYVIRGGTLSESLKTSDVTPDDVGEYMIGTNSREHAHAD